MTSIPSPQTTGACFALVTHVSVEIEDYFSNERAKTDKQEHNREEIKTLLKGVFSSICQRVLLGLFRQKVY